MTFIVGWPAWTSCLGALPCGVNGSDSTEAGGPRQSRARLEPILMWYPGHAAHGTHCLPTTPPFLACGDLECGFARVRCDQCRAEFLVAFSCKARYLCPSWWLAATAARAR